MNKIEPYGEPVGPDARQTLALRAVFARRSFFPADGLPDIIDALAFGEDALGGGLVKAEIVQACEQKTRRCFFLRRDETGEAEAFIALLYLNDAGYRALMYGRFNPEAPKLEHLAGEDEAASAIYVWCLAGRETETKRAVVRAVTEARRKAFPDIALFARPVTREGRMMTAALDAPGAGAAWLGWVPAKSAADQEDAMEGNDDGWNESGRLRAAG
jgi:hypothetical protein